MIIGGGIDGAIVNYYLSKKYKTILVDKGRFGLGNTVAATTALLEYQLDDFAEDLKPYLSEKEIEKIYKLGRKSTKEIEKINKKYKANFDFKLKPSLIYTDSKKDVEDFEKEYKFRKNVA